MENMKYGILLLLILVLILFIPVTSEIEEYIYYGHIPWNIFWFKPYRPIAEYTTKALLDERTIKERGFVVVVGNYDNTKVRIYQIPGLKLINEFTIDRMKYELTPLPNGTSFKVVTDKPATVMLMGGDTFERVVLERNASPRFYGGPGWSVYPTTFLTSTDGGYVGKEFIFLVTSLVKPAHNVIHVYSLEECKVTVYDTTGKAIESFELKPNEVKGLILSGITTYRIVSTGHVMVAMGSILTGYGIIAQHIAIGKFIYFPSATGGFIGTRFYAPSTRDWQLKCSARFTILSLKETKVTVVDLTYRKKIGGVKVGPDVVKLKPEAEYIAVESDRPIVLAFYDPDRGSGISYFGLGAGQTAKILIPEGEAYLFTYRKTTVTIDGVPIVLDADTVLPLPKGVHNISTDANIIIQAINYLRPPYAVTDMRVLTTVFGFHAFGACIPPVQSISKSYEVELKPLPVEETPYIIIVAGVALFVVLAIALFLIRRRK
ncbi:MAG: hypothetical protein DRJ49_00905 [Thermoprotei archaeon]|nr:MAG: hypothetical protein DRJ49_00905 [Thermoprotei archaeon]